MIKKIFFFLVILISLFFLQTEVKAQGVNPVASYSAAIPTFSCGVAGDTTGRDKCCYIPVTFKCSNPVIDAANTFLHFIPSTSNFVDNYLKSCQDINSYTSKINDSPCVTGDPSTSDFSNPSCKCIDKKITNPSQGFLDMCAKYLSGNPNEATSCVQCASGNGMWTGMGCLPLDLKTLISSFVLSTGIGIGGLLALLCIIYSTFTIQSSGGNPEKLKKAQENMTSCIMGLMLVIFSIFILKIIGVNILRIPFFG